MGHFSALADCNDEEDAMISDLQHRDDREPATESQPTTFEDTQMKRHSGEKRPLTTDIKRKRHSGEKPLKTHR